VVGGWQVNGITMLRGGFPTDIAQSPAADLQRSTCPIA
jgi:hypothetical protein